MRKTDHFLDRLNDVEVPDVWTNVSARRPGPMLPPPERHQRPLVIAVAIIVSIASLGLVIRAFDRQTTTGPATTPSPTPTTAENITITKTGTLDVANLGGLTAAEEAYGSLWLGVITDTGGTEIVRADPQSGATEHRFPVPGWSPGEWGGRGIVIGGGMVWIPGQENGQATITRIDPATNEATVLKPAADTIAYLTFGSDGMLWGNIAQNHVSSIAQIDPDTGQITQTWPFTADWALEICEAQGNVWVHEMNASNSTVHGGWLAQVVPGSAPQVTTGGTFAGPVCSSDGVWTAINGDEKAVNLASGIAEVDTATGAIIDSWSTPPIGYDIALDGVGGVWFLTANSGGQIERLDPSTGAIDAKETVDGTPIFISSSSDHIWIGTYEGRLIRFDIAPGANTPSGGSSPLSQSPEPTQSLSPTPWTTLMVSIGQPVVVNDSQGRRWILVMEDVAPSGRYVAQLMPSCPDGSQGAVGILGDHQAIQLTCGGQAVAAWFGDGTPEGSNPAPYSNSLKTTTLYAANDGRLFMSSGG